MKLSARETATVIAALRVYQKHVERGDMVILREAREIATNNGEFNSLGPDEIDTLCERVNTESDSNGFAEVVWNANDVMDRTNLSKEQAEAFLAKYEGSLQDLLVERGNDAIGTYLAMEGIEEED